MPKKIKDFMFEIMKKLPSEIRALVFRIRTEIRFLEFTIRTTFLSDRNITNPLTIYFIAPKRIIYHTNYLKYGESESLPFFRRVFSRDMRGKVIDGDWDITDWKFSDLSIYKSFKERIEQRVEWKDTEWYKGVLGTIELGNFPWDIKNKTDLDNRCRNLDHLYESIKSTGFRLNRSIHSEQSTYDEIDVNIGRNGEYLFQDGRNRLSIAKILEIDRIPVRVFVRHKKWQDFREFVYSYANTQKRGRLYQPILHPDLADIPAYDLEGHKCEDIMSAIEPHLGKERGTMLDIGANIGFFCHKFEDLGYQCYAVEQDPLISRILKKIRIAEQKNFEIINKSIFEVKFPRKMKFDVVLALNIFHHFLKTKSDFIQLKMLLRSLRMNQMFFEAHRYEDAQMKNAFVNYTQNQFVNFLLQNTQLNKYEVIYTAKNGRTIFNLTKQSKSY